MQHLDVVNTRHKAGSRVLQLLCQRFILALSRASENSPRKNKCKDIIKASPSWEMELKYILLIYKM